MKGESGIGLASLALAAALTACTSGGSSSSPPPDASPADTTPPTPPTALTATATANSPSAVTLSWQPSTDAVGVSGYRVERCAGAGCSDFAQIATPTAASFTDAGLQASTSYSYRARASDAAANLSAYSNVATATTAALPPPPPPVAAFFCSFASSATDCGFLEQAKVSGRASVVGAAQVSSVAGLAHVGAALGRDGPTAVRLHTEPGDSSVAGSGANERDDLTLSQSETDCFEGREQWWAHSILFPDDYVDPPQSTSSSWNWAVVFDFHNADPGAGQANFQINAWPATALPGNPTGLAFQIAHGDQAQPTVNNFPIGPIARNTWYDFVYHVKWSSGSDGFFTAWVNGAKKMDYIGPTLYAGQGCYLKLANYHTPFGAPSSVIHDRVLEGSSAAAVALTPLEGVSAQ